MTTTPIRRYYAGAAVPEWIERVEPAASQLRVTFAIDVEVEKDETGKVHVWPMVTPADGRILNGKLPDGVVEDFRVVVHGAPTHLHQKSREDEAAWLACVVFGGDGPAVIVNNSLDAPAERNVVIGSDVDLSPLLP